MRILMVAVLALGAAGAARAQDGVVIAPPPPWVVPVDAPPRAADVSGLAPRLMDYQTRLDETGVHKFGHLVFYLSSPAAVQSAGVVTITWSPALGRATVHKLVIHRGDQRIDVLKGGAGFNVIQREARLESLQLNGMLTGVLQVPDLRVGDELEFSFTIDRRNTAIGDHSDDEDLLRGLAPIDRLFVRYSWPIGRKVSWRVGDRLPSARSETTGGVNAIVIDQLQVKPPAPIPGAPPRYLDRGAIDLSDFASWRQVAEVTAPLFDKASHIAPDSPLNAEIEKIGATSPDPAVRTAMALKLVQSQVRYFARLDGLGGYVPQSADTVWRTRSGDCKGKTVLLVALLRGLGVEAEPAFVSTLRGDGLDKALPGLTRFNHVIVRAVVADKVYWLDGTRIADRGLDSLEPPPFHWALPLGPGHRTLQAIPTPAPTYAAEEWRLDLDATAGLAAPAKAEGGIIYRGDEAAALRAAASLVSRETRDRQLRKIWQDRYDWITVDKVTYEDDAASGEVRLGFTGSGSLNWHDGPQDAGKEVAARFEASGSRMGLDIAPKRDSDVAGLAPVLVAPRYQVVHETILLPNGGAGFSLQGDPIDETIGGVHYQRAVSLRGGRFEMTATTRAAGGELSFADAQAADRQTNLLFDRRVLIRKPDSRLASTGSRSAESPWSAEDLKGVSLADMQAFQAAVKLMQQGKTDAALAAANQIHTGGRLKVEVAALRGVLLAALDRPEEANAALDEALALDRNNVVAIKTKMSYLLRVGRAADALILADRLVLLVPESEEAYRLRGLVRQAAHDDKGALADWDIAIAKQSGDPSMYVNRLKALLGTGQRQKADSEADAAAARFPDNANVQAAHAALLARAGRMADARQAAARSLQLQPNADAYLIRINYGFSGNIAATLKEMLAEIALDPTRPLPPGPLRKVIALPNARRQLEAAYDAVRTQDPRVLARIKRSRAAVAAAAGDPAAALAFMDEDAAKHPNEARWLNEACWARATYGVQLDKALADCNAAVALDRAAYDLDSRAFVQLRLKAYPAAITDYDAALGESPAMPTSLFGRGLAKLRSGDRAGGEADLAAARKIDASIDSTFAAMGVRP